MHEAIAFLKRQTFEAKKVVDELAKALEKQSELETRKLEALEFGADEQFDGRAALPQERLVEAIQDALEGVEEARDSLIRASEAWKRVK